MFNQTREGKVCKNTFLSEMIYLKLVSGPLSYLQLKKKMPKMHVIGKTVTENLLQKPHLFMFRKLEESMNYSQFLTYVYHLCCNICFFHVISLIC